MKKIIEAFNTGTNGEPAKDRAGRVARAANKLGRAYGQSIDRQNDALDREMRAVIDEAIKLAAGSNRTALEVIDVSSAVPNGDASKPSWHTGRAEPNTHRLLSREWLGIYKSPGVHQDDAFDKSALPLVEDIGVLRIGHKDMPGVGIDVPIRTIFVACSSKVGEDGKMRPATTTISINQESREIDSEALRNKYHNTELDGVLIELDENGAVTTIRQSLNNGLGNDVEADPSQTTVNVEELLTGLKGSVLATADAYAGLSQL